MANIHDITFSNEKTAFNLSPKSTIDVSYIPEELIQYANENFKRLFELHPEKRGAVIMFEQETPSARWYQSYMNTPEYDPKLGYSYMFSGLKRDVQEKLPDEFVPFLEYMNKGLPKGEEYNQVVINWYENGEDYIAYHSDCEVGMQPNADIAMISLTPAPNTDVEHSRIFKFVPKKSEKTLYASLSFICRNGLLISMKGQTQTEFRHGVPKNPSHEYPRISITFRKFLTR